MNESLYKLVYISRNEIAGDEAIVRREIEQILASARGKNPPANITGALMFNAGCFAQVLEGQHDEIQNTFETIQCDTRHSHVVVLAFEPAAKREFSNWSMAYHGADSGASAKFGDIMQASGFDPAMLKGERIFDLLKEHLLEAESSSF
jgi:Sensors of blue-light using FAD